jgi:feruloyl esterase
MRILLGLVAAATLSAQTKPAIGCADLRALTNNEITIAIAITVPAAADVPEHCRVVGQIIPQIGFEVRLPTAWNGSFYMFGNGGYAGEALETPGRIAVAARALKRGFAVAQTDTGHSALKEPEGTFAVDRQKLLDWAFRSLHVTAEAGKMLARAYYAAAPAKSYFEGCSTGGRQGLILAQRFPNDFDGIVVGAPVLNWTGSMMSAVRSTQTLKANPITSAKLPLLAEKIYAKCDAVDGVKDGLIEDPRRCDFKPSRDLPRCQGAEQPDCFTAGQIAAVETLASDVMSNGTRVFPGWPVGSEAAGPNGRSGWDQWIVRDNGPTLDTMFAENFFRYVLPTKPDPQFDLSQFSIDRDRPKLEAIHYILDATDTDLTRFRQHGGKILMYFGWADPALNPIMGIEYYEQVTAKMGKDTPNFYRLFMVPGMFHCGGGPGPSAVDWFAPLETWVEKGEAPSTILARHVDQGKVTRTRPLCAYPETAKYKGAGSVDDAANFTCGK